MRYLIKQLKPVVLLILFCSSLPLQTATVFAQEAAVATQSAEREAPEFEESKESKSPEAPVATQAAQPALVETGSASASIRSAVEVGTQIVSSSPATEAASSPEQSNTTSAVFQKAVSCTDVAALLRDLKISITDQTTVEQVYSLIVNTGMNSVDLGSITTGSASAQLQLAQHINTTLIGDCWSYFDISVFSERSEDIVLPDFAQIADQASKQVAKLASRSSQLSATVSSSVTENLLTTISTNTGKNSIGIGTVETGSAYSSVQTIDTLNKSILGDNWFYLEIYNPQYWFGELIGHNGTFHKTDSVWYLWETLNPAFSAAPAAPIEQSLATIEVNRTATLNTQISMDLTTGENTVSEAGSIKTGDANSSIKIRNNINSTLIGNNWYYASINLFAPFTGNLVFAQPQPQQSVAKTEQPEEVLPESTPTPVPTPSAVGGVVVQTNESVPEIQKKVLPEPIVPLINTFLFASPPTTTERVAARYLTAPSVLGASTLGASTETNLFSPRTIACQLAAVVTAPVSEDLTTQWFAELLSIFGQAYALIKTIAATATSAYAGEFV